MVKFVLGKDAAGNTYYKTSDKKFLIVRDGKTWTVMRLVEFVKFPVYIWDGYTKAWSGFSKLSDAKIYVAEYYQ